MPDELIQIRKPELGRPNDRRVTQEYIDARPELAGLSPFVEGQDVDLVEEVNTAMQGLHALVTYADPELGPALREVLDVEVPAKLQEMTDIIADTAQTADYVLASAGSDGYNYNGEAWPTTGVPANGAHGTLRTSDGVLAGTVTGGAWVTQGAPVASKLAGLSIIPSSRYGLGDPITKLRQRLAIYATSGGEFGLPDDPDMEYAASAEGIIIRAGQIVRGLRGLSKIRALAGASENLFDLTLGGALESVTITNTANTGRLGMRLGAGARLRDVTVDGWSGQFARTGSTIPPGTLSGSDGSFPIWGSGAGIIIDGLTMRDVISGPWISAAPGLQIPRADIRLRPGGTVNGQHRGLRINDSPDAMLGTIYIENGVLGLEIYRFNDGPQGGFIASAVKTRNCSFAGVSLHQQTDGILHHISDGDSIGLEVASSQNIQVNARIRGATRYPMTLWGGEGQWGNLPALGLRADRNIINATIESSGTLYVGGDDNILNIRTKNATGTAVLFKDSATRNEATIHNTDLAAGHHVRIEDAADNTIRVSGNGGISGAKISSNAGGVATGNRVSVAGLTAENIVVMDAGVIGNHVEMIGTLTTTFGVSDNSGNTTNSSEYMLPTGGRRMDRELQMRSMIPASAAQPVLVGPPLGMYINRWDGTAGTSVRHAASMVTALDGSNQIVLAWFLETSQAAQLNSSGLRLFSGGFRAANGLGYDAITADGSLRRRLRLNAAGRWVNAVLNGSSVDTGENYTVQQGPPIATITVDFPSIAALSSVTQDMAVTRASLIDGVDVTIRGPGTPGVTVRGYVSAADTVRLVATNNTGAAIDPPSMNLTVKVTSA
ncbi:hypothetical protein [Deinococcus sp. 6GRE01]|uniref:hypothetical protein n=1 Tax=Deinococcus sp. 6GRE01 TaxID=2745873 RepID=UPI001E61EAB1|nr:hypothetical protein [Deinococcus sp. 6GRE01]MCD0156001.1 hypothetical protein [Deinococcus sp. 6GRE01]